MRLYLHTTVSPTAYFLPFITHTFELPVLAEELPELLPEWLELLLELLFTGFWELFEALPAELEVLFGEPLLTADEFPPDIPELPELPELFEPPVLLELPELLFLLPELSPCEPFEFCSIGFPFSSTIFVSVTTSVFISVTIIVPVVSSVLDDSGFSPQPDITLAAIAENATSDAKAAIR